MRAEQCPQFHIRRYTGKWVALEEPRKAKRRVQKKARLLHAGTRPRSRLRAFELRHSAGPPPADLQRAAAQARFCGSALDGGGLTRFHSPSPWQRGQRGHGRLLRAPVGGVCEADGGTKEESPGRRRDAMAWRMPRATTAVGDANRAARRRDERPIGRDLASVSTVVVQRFVRSCTLRVRVVGTRALWGG